MKVEVDEKSGFCFSVDLAVKKAEEEIQKTGKVYCLGQIVHNDMEVKRLEDMGMVTINHEQLKTLKDVTVLIRAHGEPPETYEIAEKNGIQIIDASIKKFYPVRSPHLNLMRIVYSGFNI